MKTNYKMLWIDDNFKTLRGDKRKFENYFKRHGITFEPIEIEQNPDGKVVEDEKFLNAVNDIELDVVLIDFNMSGETGADIGSCPCSAYRSESPACSSDRSAERGRIGEDQ